MMHLSRDEARRIALAAQGLAAKPRRAGDASWATLARTIDKINLLQIDSVNVLCRSHYLPLFSRLGRYRRETLDARAFTAGRKRALFEYWAHEASLLPLDLHPLMRWRMEDARSGQGIYKGLSRFAHEKRKFVREVLGQVRERGPLTARELAEPGQRTGPWWGWHDGKTALEYLFWAGEVTATGRQSNFERVYDLPERALPAEVLSLPTPAEPDAIRELMRRSALALGVASEPDLRDYFRLPVAASKRALAELAEDGVLVPATVEGWRIPGWLHRDAALPRRATGTALLSPFDPIVWERSRAERLFGFRYRIEIYTPAPKRAFGYYVLPFLHKGRFTARVCLKADRPSSVLRVNSAHGEEGRQLGETAEALMPELRELALWLGLERVVVTERGDLAKPLRQAA
ncbi:MAG: winged helix-turn-helix domain-containing protein [Parvibaculaceae bacterium]